MKHEMLLLLLLFLALASSCSVPYVQTCALAHVDTNGDGQLSVAELDFFISENPCNARPMPTSGAKVISVCDGNADGQLGASEVQCLSNPGLLALACSICASCEAK